MSLVQTAVELTARRCNAIERNQACYGSPALTAEAQPGLETFAFSQSGDVVQADAIRSLTLDAANQSWGVARLKLQADLPDDTDQSAVLVLFGTASLQNKVEFTGSLTTFTITADKTINIRSSPSPDGEIIAVLNGGEGASVNGRSEDGQWLRIVLPGEQDRYGWVFAALVQGINDSSLLTSVNSGSLRLNPMQSLTFSSGIDDAPCAGTPNSGLLVQSPVQTPVNLFINGVQLQLTGTAYLQSAADLAINVIEGSALVTALDSVRSVPAGTQVVVPLDEANTASEAPSLPGPYLEKRLVDLPLNLLDHEVVIAPALQSQAGDCILTMLREVNLRTGPGTDYTVQETLSEGASGIADGYVLTATKERWWRLQSHVWVRADLVSASDNCAALVEVAAPPPPPPVEATPENVTINTFYYINNCTFVGDEAGADDTVQLLYGSGSWPTTGEARTALFGLKGSLTLDGAPLDSFLGIVRWNQNDYGVAVKSNWLAESGSHTISANLSLFGGVTNTCSFNIP